MESPSFPKSWINEFEIKTKKKNVCINYKFWFWFCESVWKVCSNIGNALYVVWSLQIKLISKTVYLSFGSTIKINKHFIITSQSLEKFYLFYLNFSKNYISNFHMQNHMWSFSGMKTTETVGFPVSSFPYWCLVKWWAFVKLAWTL